MSETWEVVCTRAIYGIIGDSQSNSLAIQILKSVLKLICKAYVFLEKHAQAESKGPPSSTCWSLAGYDPQYVTQYIPCMLFSGFLGLIYLSRWANFAFRHLVKSSSISTRDRPPHEKDGQRIWSETYRFEAAFLKRAVSCITLTLVAVVGCMLNGR